uniref:Uncharacterized protein n=1 Tax=Arundo donax TaxID=35708 RepID=A0A0A9AWZ5_ARUDO
MSVHLYHLGLRFLWLNLDSLLFYFSNSRIYIVKIIVS